MHDRPHKRQLTRFSYAALVAVLCPSIGHAQLLPNQALTVELSTGNLHVIDDSGAILSTVFAGPSPIDVVVTPDGTTAVVTLFAFGPDQAVRFDLTTPVPTLTGSVELPLFGEDVDLACTSTGFALITDGGGVNLLASVDVATMTLVQTLVLPFDAEAVEVTPDGSLAVVASTFSNLVQFVSISGTGTLMSLGFETSGIGPLNVAISPNGNIAIVPNVFDGTVSVYNLGTQSLVGSIFLAPSDNFGNQSVVFSPDGSKAYVYDVRELSGGSISVLAIDSLDNVTDTGIRIGVTDAPAFFGVDQLAISPSGTDLYVRSRFGYLVVDPSILAITASNFAIPVGSGTRSGGVATLCCPCGLFTTTDFESPMGKSKKLKRTLPIKFRLFFDGVEITSEEQLNEVLEDNGCTPGCPELIVTKLDDDPLGLPLDNEPNVGDPDEGNCFRYSAPNWIYNLRLTPDEPAEFETGCYRVEILIGNCLITSGNNVFDIK